MADRADLSPTHQSKYEKCSSPENRDSILARVEAIMNGVDPSDQTDEAAQVSPEGESSILVQLERNAANACERLGKDTPFARARTRLFGVYLIYSV